jgi:nucleoid DNA-binding protein
VNRTELIRGLRRQGHTDAEARRAVDMVTGAITAALCAGEPVLLTGFGVFRTTPPRGAFDAQPAYT